MQLCVSLVTQPREDQSGSEGTGQGGSAALEPLPVRLEALQVGDNATILRTQTGSCLRDVPFGILC